MPTGLPHAGMGSAPAVQPRAVLASYANYFEVGHNAFEFLIDACQVEPQSGSVQLMGRIAVSPVHAKVLSQLLARAIAQFESAHHDIPDIDELGGMNDDLFILSQQEFERRAMDARSRPVSGSRPDESEDTHPT